MSADDVTRAVAALNAALEADRAAVSAVVGHRVACGEGLALLVPTMLVDSRRLVGFLGLLNAALGDGVPGRGVCGPVVAIMGDDGQVARFEAGRLTGPACWRRKEVG
jgi:hypothetical protein